MLVLRCHVNRCRLITVSLGWQLLSLRRSKLEVGNADVCPGRGTARATLWLLCTLAVDPAAEQAKQGGSMTLTYKDDVSTLDPSMSRLTDDAPYVDRLEQGEEMHESRHLNEPMAG